MKEKGVIEYMDNKELLWEFLKTPLTSADELYERFSALPGAVFAQGELPFQRYVYVPGERKDRVLLVAHIDTVWDVRYGKEKKPDGEVVDLAFKDGIFYNTNKKCGIGADDRAGCAMLWKLKDSGHSILIVDGEEHGKIGARYIKKSNKKLFNELNNHCFMLELDHIFTNHICFNQVINSDKFKSYIMDATGFEDKKLQGGCDLQILSKRICGANIGIGYQYYHTWKEKLVLADWENTYQVLESFLAKPQERYTSPLTKRFKSFIARNVFRVLRKLKLKK